MTAKEKNEPKSPFWAFQVTAWSLLFLATMAVNLLRGNDHWSLVVLSMVVAGGGLVTTSMYRGYIKRQNYRSANIREVLLPLLLGSLVTSILWTSVIVISQFILHAIAPSSALSIDSISVSLTAVNNYFLVLLWGILYFAWHYFHIAQTARIERYRSEAAVRDAQLNTLKGQINPHFMFNALNNIRALMLEDAQRSREMLLKLSELLRYSMNMSEKKEVKLEQELRIVEDFLALNKIQYEDRLHYSIECAAGLENVTIPPMVVQILVENSVKHGVSALKDGGSVNINIFAEHPRLIIEVSNSGGWNRSTGTKQENNGIGLPNVRRRLKLLYGEEARLHLREENSRVIARVEIPIHHE